MLGKIKLDYDKLRALRNKDGRSQAQLAYDIGTSQHVISKIENNRTANPSFELVANIAMELKIELISDLITQ